MAWPTQAARCDKPGISVGHGIYLCHDCEETAAKDLQRRKQQALEADRQIKALAHQAAGPSTPHAPIYPHKGEVLGGRFEENRSKH